MAFTGGVDLEAFLLYETIFMDELSLAYLNDEIVLSDKYKYFLRELVEDGIVKTINYKNEVRFYRYR